EGNHDFRHSQRRLPVVPQRVATTLDRLGLRFTPDGWHTVTPRIVVHGAPGLVEFVKYVFGATGDYLPDRPSVMDISDSMVLISEAAAHPPVPAFLYIYVVDADETYQRALQRGARSLEEPADMPYGDRRGMVEDEWGTTRQIATFMGDLGSTW